MTESFTLSPPRLVAPIAALFVAIALVAVLALGFGLRVWTEHTPRPTAPASVVSGVAPAAPSPVCRVGRPC